MVAAQPRRTVSAFPKLRRDKKIKNIGSRRSPQWVLTDNSSISAGQAFLKNGMIIMITLLTLIFLYFFKIDFLYLEIFNIIFYFYATLLYFNEHENKYEIYTNFNYYYKEPFYFLEPKPKFKKIIDFITLMLFNAIYRFFGIGFVKFFYSFAVSAVYLEKFFSMDVFFMALKVDLAVILGSILGNLSGYLSCAFNEKYEEF